MGDMVAWWVCILWNSSLFTCGGFSVMGFRDNSFNSKADWLVRFPIKACHVIRWIYLFVS